MKPDSQPNAQVTEDHRRLAKIIKWGSVNAVYDKCYDEITNDAAQRIANHEAKVRLEGADRIAELEHKLAEARAARRDEESWWKERHDYKNRAEQAEARVKELDGTLDKILTDKNYEGGVQFWIEKHDRLLDTMALTSGSFDMILDERNQLRAEVEELRKNSISQEMRIRAAKMRNILDIYGKQGTNINMLNEIDWFLLEIACGDTAIAQQEKTQ